MRINPENRDEIEVRYVEELVSKMTTVQLREHATSSLYSVYDYYSDIELEEEILDNCGEDFDWEVLD